MTGLLARMLARLFPGRGKHAQLPDPDDTVVFPRIPDDGIPPSMMTVLDLPPGRTRPYVQDTEEDQA